MNHARLESSARLKRLARLLIANRGRWLTTRDIVKRAECMAVNSAAAELRENGWDIACRQSKRRGERVFEYLATRVPAKHLELLA